jgi:hypothetical protein
MDIKAPMIGLAVDLAMPSDELQRLIGSPRPPEGLGEVDDGLERGGLFHQQVTRLAPGRMRSTEEAACRMGSRLFTRGTSAPALHEVPHRVHRG